MGCSRASTTSRWAPPRSSRGSSRASRVSLGRSPRSRRPAAARRSASAPPRCISGSCATRSRTSPPDRAAAAEARSGDGLLARGGPDHHLVAHVEEDLTRLVEGQHLLQLLRHRLPDLARGVLLAIDVEKVLEVEVLIEEALREEDLVAWEHALGGVGVGDHEQERASGPQHPEDLFEDVVEIGVLEEVRSAHLLARVLLE